MITYSLPELPVRNLDTSEDFSTIQAAIDAVNTTNGHTITVDPRIYNENVNVYKQLTIRSSSGSPADTIVQAADSNDHVFEVAADYVNISGFTLKGAAYNCGVHCKHESLVIINNIVTGNYWGIGCWDGASPNINNNMIKNNIVDGLYVYSSSPVIDKNTIVGNGRAGITLRGDSSPRITNNSFINNTHGINCNYAIGTLTIISGNYIYENTDGIVIDGSSNSTINNNNISSNEYGIKLRYSSNNNTIYNNYFNNTNNAYDNGNNQWNITKTLGTNIIGGSYFGGNYWSDYAGEDSDGDGLGDTMHPYNSFGNIQNGGDYLPLTTPAVTPTPEATTVSISPSTKTISPGPFTVNVTVEPELPIAGVQFDLSFNPSLVRANNVTEGNLLKRGGANTFFYSGTIDNAAGTITHVASAITTPGETVSTPTVFATIQMTAKSAAGTSTLDLSNVIVGDINGNPVSITVNNGSVTISTVPWDINGDGFVNVLDMILVGQHFGETGAPGWIPEDVNCDGVIDVRDMLP